MCKASQRTLGLGGCDKVRVKRPQERKQHAPRRTRETRCQQGATQDPPPDRHAIVFCLRCLVGRVGQPGRGRARVAQRVFRRASQGPQGRVALYPSGGCKARPDRRLLTLRGVVLTYVLPVCSANAKPTLGVESLWLFRWAYHHRRTPYTLRGPCKLCLSVSTCEAEYSASRVRVSSLYSAPAREKYLL